MDYTDPNLVKQVFVRGHGEPPARLLPLRLLLTACLLLPLLPCCCCRWAVTSLLPPVLCHCSFHAPDRCTALNRCPPNPCRDRHPHRQPLGQPQRDPDRGCQEVAGRGERCCAHAFLPPSPPTGRAPPLRRPQASPARLTAAAEGNSPWDSRQRLGVGPSKVRANERRCQPPPTPTPHHRHPPRHPFVRLFLCSQTAGIPADKIQGFRAPFLVFSPEQRDILAENGGHRWAWRGAALGAARLPCPPACPAGVKAPSAPDLHPLRAAPQAACRSPASPKTARTPPALHQTIPPPPPAQALVGTRPSASSTPPPSPPPPPSACGPTQWTTASPRTAPSGGWACNRLVGRQVSACLGP